MFYFELNFNNEYFTIDYDIWIGIDGNVWKKKRYGVEIQETVPTFFPQTKVKRTHEADMDTYAAVVIIHHSRFNWPILLPNVEMFQWSSPWKNSSVCSEENYWFPCSLNGGNVLCERSRVQVGFLSVLAAVCLSLHLLFVEAVSSVLICVSLAGCFLSSWWIASETRF